MNGKPKPRRANRRQAQGGSGPRPQAGRRRRRRRNRRRFIVNARAGLGFAPTRHGEQFLRAAFAPYDFAQDGTGGVPDAFRGPAFTIQQRQTIVIDGTTAHRIAVLPMPEVMFADYTSDTPITPTTAWTPNFFTANREVWATVGTKIRIIGLTVEFKSIGSLLATQGVMMVARVPVKLELEEVDIRMRAAGGAADVTFPSAVHSIRGLASGFLGLSSDRHCTFANKDGAYAVGLHSGPWVLSDYTEFGGIDDNTTPESPIATTPMRLPPRIPISGGSPADTDSDGALLWKFGDVIGGRPHFFDNSMSAILIDIPKTDANVKFAVEVIMLVEVMPVINSALSKVVRSSPDHDPQTLDWYEKLGETMPIAVESVGNASFWQTILQGAKYLAAGASFAPGYVGAIGTGISSVISGVEGLWLSRRRDRRRPVDIDELD